jgi:hypothetical protein
MLKLSLICYYELKICMTFYGDSIKEKIIYYNMNGSVQNKSHNKLSSSKHK